MGSESPLAAAVAQSFRNGEATISRTYRGVPISPNAEDAYAQLSTVDPPLPLIGDTLGQTAYKVRDVDIRPIGSRNDVCDVVITYSTLPASGGVATVADQPPSDVTFELFPELAEVDVEGARATPIITKTVELDSSGQPADPPVEIGTARPQIEPISRRYSTDRARVTYTITGTASQLGIPEGFTFGTIPYMLDQQRRVHVIGGVPLLYRTGSIRIATRGISAAANTYAISHEWTHDPGTRLEETPLVWATNPAFGPVGDQVTVTDSIGAVQANADGDVLSGVFLPRVLAPTSLGALYGVTNRYLVPPFCTVDMVIKIDRDYPYPSFVVNPQYKSVSANAWQSLPGVAPFTGGP